MKKLNKILGCLVGGAVGDALGYPVEFLSEKEIFDTYGHRGITNYELVDGKALISDDTQMTLFTANGLLLGDTRGCMRGIKGSYESYIVTCYQEWLRTQCESYPLSEQDEYQYSWLLNVPELFNPREPGRTCIKEVGRGCQGTIENPINNSKGCGGIMRVAPIGVYSSKLLDWIPMLGARVAALTHTHELGYIPAYVLVDILQRIHHTDSSLKSVIKDALNDAIEEFGGKASEENLNCLERLITLAIELSERNDITDLEAIHLLGEGWVAEETLAIAIYCSLKYQNSFEDGIIASVNHKGDSDSTGSVTGQILGAYLGFEAIPLKYIENLELINVIKEMAHDLAEERIPISEYEPIVTPKQKEWANKYMR